MSFERKTTQSFFLNTLKIHYTQVTKFKEKHRLPPTQVKNIIISILKFFKTVHTKIIAAFVLLITHSSKCHRVRKDPKSSSEQKENTTDIVVYAPQTNEVAVLIVG